jgi:pyrroline-5-carboxylate reductase
LDQGKAVFSAQSSFTQRRTGANDMASMRGVRVGVIGAGAIGGVVIDRLLNGAEARAEDLIACEPRDARREEVAQRFHVRTTTDLAEAAATDLIVLAVPPLEVAKVLRAIGERLGHRPVVVSFAAAVPLDVLEAALPAATPVVRVNPNSPSLVGEGFNPVTYGSGVTGPARALVDRFLTALGASVEIRDQAMNLYTALTAVGPTYFLPVLDAMITAGVEGGLTREAAVIAATATARGTAMLAAQRAENPDQLKLFTGLRPLRDAEVRDLVKQAIADANSRMNSLQQQVTSPK